MQEKALFLFQWLIGSLVPAKLERQDGADGVDPGIVEVKLATSFML